MTKTELSRFQAVLNAKVVEMEPIIRHRDCIRIERTAYQVEEHPASFRTRNRGLQSRPRISSAAKRWGGHLFVSMRAVLGGASIVMKTSSRSGSRPCRGPISIRCLEAVDRNSENMQAPGDLLPSAALKTDRWNKALNHSAHPTRPVALFRVPNRSETSEHEYGQRVASISEEIVGSSKPLDCVLEHVTRVAPTNATVLITGEHVVTSA